MIKKATSDLFHATKQRLYIRSVKILIPLTWSQKATYVNRSREKYEEAHVIIANTFFNTGDSPYTKQYGGCREQGRFIHLTPNFLMNDDLTSVYGSRGKLFVREWARLRWGVFEEYNTEQPFYISPDLQIEATRCSVNISGIYRVPENVEDSCLTKICNLNPDTGLYEQPCTFFPERNQIAAESIMYFPGLQSISDFCTENTHSMEAPTMQNRMCNCHSTWDIIKNSPDIYQSPPKYNFSVPTPLFSLLRYRQRVITLVFDVSGSMATNNRLWRVNQAADIFLTEAIAPGTHVGLVEFSTYAFTLSELKQINSDTDREQLKSCLRHTATNYGSDLCLAIEMAFKVNRKLYGSLDGTEVLFMTDGSYLDFTTTCFSDIKSSGAIIHTIAISSEASKELEEIADMTGGLKYFATDNLQSNDLIDAFIGIANENGDLSQRVSQGWVLEVLDSKEVGVTQKNSSIQEKRAARKYLEHVKVKNAAHLALLCGPRGDGDGRKGTDSQRVWEYRLESNSSHVNPGDCVSGTVLVDSTVGGETFFTVTWNSSAPDINFKDPAGNLYSTEMFATDSIFHLSRLKIPESAMTGVWSYVLCNTFNSSQALGLVVTSKAANTRAKKPPITVDVHINNDTNNFPTRMTLYASISQGLLPVKGAKVTAIISSEKSETLLDLLDNGAGADIAKGDGIYSKYLFAFPVIERYNVKVRVEEEDGGYTLSYPRGRAFYLRGFVESGKVVLKPSDPLSGEGLPAVEGFRRVITGGSFVASDVSNTHDYPPGKIMDLEAQIKGTKVILLWTATGEDLDQGTVQSYELRMNKNIKELRDNFEGSIPLNISNIELSPAGTRQEFEFNPILAIAGQTLPPAGQAALKEDSCGVVLHFLRGGAISWSKFLH
ncbi:calcium-activated chloride channel regulator 1-like [Mantella aurantiaca]